MGTPWPYSKLNRFSAKKRPRLSAGSSFQTLLSQCLTLSGLNVRRGRTLGALLQLEFHLLSLGQALEARTLDGGVMHEDILAAVRRGDETETFCVIEPLYCTCIHEYTSVS